MAPQSFQQSAGKAIARKNRPNGGDFEEQQPTGGADRVATPKSAVESSFYKMPNISGLAKNLKRNVANDNQSKSVEDKDTKSPISVQQADTQTEDKSRLGTRQKLATENPNNLEDGAGEMFAGETKDRIVNPTRIRSRTEDETDSGEENPDGDKESNEKTPKDDYTSNLQAFEIPDVIANDNTSREKIDRILKKIDEKGYGKKFTNEDIRELSKSPPKIKFPTVMVVLYILSFFSSIVFSAVALSLWAIGLAATTTIIGSWIGIPVTALSFAIGITNLIICLLFSISQIIAQIHFLKNASLVVKRTNILQRTGLRRIVIWFISTTFSEFPFIGPLIWIFSGRSVYREVKRVTKHVIQIIEEEMNK